MSMEQYVQEETELPKDVQKTKTIEKTNMGPKEKNIPLNTGLELKNKKLFEGINNAISSKNCTELNKIRWNLLAWLSIEDLGTKWKLLFEIENNKLVLNDIDDVDFWGWTIERLKTTKATILPKNWKIYFEGLGFGTNISIDSQWKMMAGCKDWDPVDDRLIWWIHAIPYVWQARNDVIFPQVYRR